MTRVLIVDDQRVLRDGLTTLLGLLAEVDRRGGGLPTARRRCAWPRSSTRRSCSWTCACRAATASRRPAGCTSAHPQIKVVVLTTYADDRSVFDALRAGARGFLTKDAGAEEIARAIAAVQRGRVGDRPGGAAPPRRRRRQPGAGQPPAAPPALPDGLTPREAEVLALIAEGLSQHRDRRAARLSEATVKSHINHL